MWQPKTLINLFVADASQSASFYEALLGVTPARRDDRSIVFDLDSPPLVLTVEERRLAKTTQSGDNRFALVVLEPEHVGHAAIRLRRAGVRLRVEDQGIEARDPDGNAWRVRLLPLAQGRTAPASRAFREEGKGHENR
ncbi:MAG: VOC family protein [Myxococcota bacterium]|nr:VOC family protein [Myxococcota bacterium]